MAAPRPISSASAPSLPTHVDRNRLTPRSAEACRRTGIEPAELLPLPQSAFREAGQSDEVSRLRWEKYEELRVDAYQAVRAERARILAEGGTFGQAGASASVGRLVKGALAAGSGPIADEGASTAVEQERRIVEKIKKKQNAEIESILMFEIRSAQINKEKEDKVLAMQEADERQKRERETRAHEAAEVRRLNEIERKEAEEEAERAARRRQRQEMEREARRRAEEEEAERVRQMELDQKEKERLAKTEARRQRQQELLLVQQEEARLRQESANEKEVQRMARIERERFNKLEENERARKKQAERIAYTQRMQAQRVESQRALYVQKMADEEVRREEWEAEQQRRIEQRKQLGLEKQQAIKQAQAQMELVVEEKKYAVLEAELAHESIKAEAEQKRQQELARLAAEKEMKMYTRQLKQLRSQRRDEYKRETTAAKIQLEAARTDAMVAAKAQLMAQRKAMRASNTLARQKVGERMEAMRKSSGLSVDAEMREKISNPELLEMLERCDEAGAGDGKIDVNVMRKVVLEMQAEGKLSQLDTKR